MWDTLANHQMQKTVSGCRPSVQAFSAPVRKASCHGKFPLSGLSRGTHASPWLLPVRAGGKVTPPGSDSINHTDGTGRPSRDASPPNPHQQHQHCQATGWRQLPKEQTSDRLILHGCPQLPLRLVRRKRKGGYQPMRTVFAAIVIALAVVLCLASPAR